MSNGWFIRNQGIVKVFFLVSLVLPAGSTVFPSSGAVPQTIVVSGKPVALGATPIQLRGARLFLPIAPISRELSSELSVDLARRTVTVRRRTTGVVAEFDAKTGELRENNLVTVVIPQVAEIFFPTNADELLLPAEVIALLLDVSVAINDERREVEIHINESGQGSASSSGPAARFEADAFDYAYDFRLSGGSSVQSLGLRSTGRAGLWHYSATNVLWGGQGGILGLRNGSLFLENQRGLRLSFGDFGSAIKLRSLSTLLRGVGFEAPVGKSRFSFFTGFVTGGGSRGNGQLAQQSFDTTIVGTQFEFGSHQPQRSREAGLSLSTGAIFFSGPSARGETFAANLQYGNALNRLGAELTAGTFSGETLNNHRVQGTGTAIDINDVFVPAKSLTFQGSFVQYSRSFLTPQRNPSLNDLRSWNAGASWHPIQLFSAQFGVSDSRKLSALRKGRTTYSANFNLTPSTKYLPSVFASHSFTDNGRAGSFSLTQLTLARDYSKFRWFATLTQPSGENILERLIPDQSSGDAASIVQKFSSRSLSIGAGIEMTKAGSVQLTETFSNNSWGGAVDWYAREKFWNRIQFAAGMTYTSAPNHFSVGTRLVSNIRITALHSLQVSMAKTPNDFQLSFGLSGSLFHPRRPLSELASFNDRFRLGSMQGKVFQDINQNGRFDDGVDVPMPNVGVKLDGAHVTTTNEKGEYRFDQLEPGAHTVTLDFLTVRADLTLLGPPSQLASLATLERTSVDFRLIKTGQLSGTVWQDSNGNGKPDAGEKLFGDVRIVTSSGKDTLSDESGHFVIGDLPPGEYVVFVDERTLPAGFRNKAAKVLVRILAGKLTDDAGLTIETKPPLQIEKDFSSPDRPSPK